MDTNYELIQSLITQAQDVLYGNGNLDIVLKRTDMIIRKIFGDKSHYLDELKSIRFSPSMVIGNRGDNTGVYRRAFNSGKSNLTNLLNVMAESIELDSKITETSGVKQSVNEVRSNEVFIVHGHNDEMKLSVARTIEKLGLKPIILHEQLNKGSTIIEKFTANSSVSFAVVILSADDVAYPKDTQPEKAKYRARQNVIFELGYFIGKLGREKVLALYESGSNLEIPTDYSGVIFVPYDKSGSWKFELVRELKALNIDVDANKIL